MAADELIKKLYGLKVSAEQGGVNDGIKKQAADLRSQIGDNSIGSNMNAKQFYDAYLSGSNGGGDTSGKSSSSSFNYRPQTVNYGAIQKRVSGQIDPLRQQAIKDIQTKTTQDRFNAGTMAANRGLAQSGLAADLQNKLTLGENDGIQRTNANYDAQIAQLAQQNYQQEQGRQDQLMRDAYARYRDGVGDQRFADQQREQQKAQNIQNAQWFMQQYGVPIQPKNDYQYLVDQVKGLKPLNVQQTETQNKQWQQRFDQENEQNKKSWNYKYDERDYNRDKDEDQESKTRYTNDAIGKILTFDNQEDAIGMINDMGEEMLSRGVDMTSVWSAIKDRFPNVKPSDIKIPIPMYDPEKWEDYGGYDGYLDYVGRITGNPQ